VTVTDESFAFIAAVTFANSSPVTEESDAPPPAGGPVPLGAAGDWEAVSALASDEAPNTRAPAATTPAAANPIRLMAFIDFIDTLVAPFHPRLRLGARRCRDAKVGGQPAYSLSTTRREPVSRSPAREL
jgi:hypothetical protein